MRDREWGQKPPMKHLYLLNLIETKRSEALARTLEGEIVRRGRLVGHIGRRPKPKEATERIRGYPEPAIAVRRVSQREAQVISFPDGECLSEPMSVREACNLVRELLES